MESNLNQDRYLINMDDKTIITLWAMSVIAGLQAVAIIWAVDGAYFGLVIAVLSALGGHVVTKNVLCTKPHVPLENLEFASIMAN